MCSCIEPARRLPSRRRPPPPKGRNLRSQPPAKAGGSRLTTGTPRSAPRPGAPASPGRRPGQGDGGVRGAGLVPLTGVQSSSCDPSPIEPECWHKEPPQRGHTVPPHVPHPRPTVPLRAPAQPAAKHNTRRRTNRAIQRQVANLGRTRTGEPPDIVRLLQEALPSIANLSRST
jgi:hypothetical protein